MVTQVRVTANFQENLDSIRDFLQAQEASGAFDTLIQRLFDEVIPNLALFPAMGRDFQSHVPSSEEGGAKLQRLRGRSRLPPDIREYITGEYLLLYLLRDSTVYLLSIRHHRQLSFDLRTHWL